MKNIRNRGFTLVEVLIVVVIMAVLAAVVIPQFSSTTDDARKSTTEFNLSTMRSIFQTYRGQLLPALSRRLHECDSGEFGHPQQDAPMSA